MYGSETKINNDDGDDDDDDDHHHHHHHHNNNNKYNLYLEIKLESYIFMVKNS